MTISTVRKFGVGVASAAMVLGLAGPAMAAPMDNRLAGADRYDTAIKIAEDSTEFANPSVVYVSRGDVLVDAVTAGTLKNGPMLLVNDNADVQDKVAQAIRKLGVAKIVVIGGEKAVSKETLDKITPAGVATERISGKDRYETAVKIGEKMIAPKATTLAADKTVYLANGMSLVDALVGGQLVDGPILLTDGSGKLPAATANALNTKFYNSPVVALGGTKAVTNEELTAANVAKVIIPDSFIQDFQKEIKAAAETALKVDGYYTVSSKANKDDVITAALSAIPAANQKIARAQIEATWPKINAIVAPSGNFYIPTKADDGSIDTDVTQPVAMASAVGYKAEKLDDGSAATNYIGTSKAVTAAGDLYNTANTASSTIDTNTTDTTGTWVTTGTVLANDASLSTTLASNTPKELFEALTDVFGTIKGSDDNALTSSSTIKDLLKAVIPASVYAANVDTSANKYTQGSDSGATAAKNVISALKTAVAVKVASLQSAVTSAASANKSAMKAMKDASDTLQDRIAGRIPSGSLDRIAGADRYSTSVEIAKNVFGDKGGKNSPIRIYFANGNAFADAAVSGMLTRGPVLLVGKDMVPSTVNDYAKTVANNIAISRKSIIALGGTAVIEAKNLTDELNVLSPVGEGNKDYSASFSASTVAGGQDMGTGATVVPKVATGTATTVDITPTVENLPNGGNKKVFWQYNAGNGWKTAEGKAVTLNGKTVTVTDNGETSGAYQVSVTSSGTQDSSAGGEAKVKSLKVRLVVSITNGNGDTIVADQASTPVTVNYSIN